VNKGNKFIILLDGTVKGFSSIERLQTSLSRQSLFYALFQYFLSVLTFKGGSPQQCLGVLPKFFGLISKFNSCPHFTFLYKQFQLREVPSRLFSEFLFSKIIKFYLNIFSNYSLYLNDGT